ncbi:MAG: FliO/MopB family protein [Fidelibacterota bacterium]
MISISGVYRKRIPIFLAGLFLFTAAPGQEPAASDSLFNNLPPVPEAIGHESSVLWLLLASAFLVVILVVALFLIKRRQSEPANSGALVFRMKKYIGPRQYLTVVSVGKQHLLLGVTEHNITLLSEIDDISELEKLGLGSPSLSFATVLNRIKPG